MDFSSPLLGSSSSAGPWYVGRNMNIPGIPSIPPGLTGLGAKTSFVDEATWIILVPRQELNLQIPSGLKSWDKYFDIVNSGWFRIDPRRTQGQCKEYINLGFEVFLPVHGPAEQSDNSMAGVGIQEPLWHDRGASGLGQGAALQVNTPQGSSIAPMRSPKPEATSFSSPQFGEHTNDEHWPTTNLGSSLMPIEVPDGQDAWNRNPTQGNLLDDVTESKGSPSARPAYPDVQTLVRDAQGPSQASVKKESGQLALLKTVLNSATSPDASPNPPTRPLLNRKRAASLRAPLQESSMPRQRQLSVSGRQQSAHPRRGNKHKPLTPEGRREKARKRGRVCPDCRHKKVRCPHVPPDSPESTMPGSRSPGMESWSTRMTSEFLTPSSSYVDPFLQAFPGPQTPDVAVGDSSPISLCDFIGDLYIGTNDGVCPKCRKSDCKRWQPPQDLGPASLGPQ